MGQNPWEARWHHLIPREWSPHSRDRAGEKQGVMDAPTRGADAENLESPQTPTFSLVLRLPALCTSEREKPSALF